MTGDEAKSWLVARNVSRGTLAHIDLYVTMLREEALVQNLIAASTFETIWTRHVVDSAQLLDHASGWESWVDLGSGAGFPGLIVALLTDREVTLVESRAKRIDFLRRAVLTLGLEDRVEVVGQRVETMLSRRYEVISARALAPLSKLLQIGLPLSDLATKWILPKGRSAGDELAAAHSSWQGRFELVPSVTDPEASIIVATGVTPRKHR